MPEGISIERLFVGQEHSKRVRITEGMMVDFAHSLGDHTSFHQDPEKAKRSFYGRNVSPGMLTASLIGMVLGTEFPGEGTIYVSQELNFLRPVFAGDELTLRVTVRQVLSGRNRVRVQTKVINQEGETVLDGLAEVMPPRALNGGADCHAA